MRVQQVAELPQLLGGHVAAGHPRPQRSDEAVQLHVLLEDPPQQRRVARARGVGGEQALLLVAEVAHRLGEEEVDVRACRRETLVRPRVGRGPEPARLHELVMVVVRERNQGRMALHAPSSRSP